MSRAVLGASGRTFDEALGARKCPVMMDCVVDLRPVSPEMFDLG